MAPRASHDGRSGSLSDMADRVRVARDIPCRLTRRYLLYFTAPPRTASRHRIIVRAIVRRPYLCALRLLLTTRPFLHAASSLFERCLLTRDREHAAGVHTLITTIVGKRRRRGLVCFRAAAQLQRGAPEGGTSTGRRAPGCGRVRRSVELVQARQPRPERRWRTHWCRDDRGRA